MSIQLMISYPSEREAEAREVYDFLTSLGLSVWFDKESLVAGDDWDREIAQAIQSAELIVVITSSETVSKRGVVQRELNKILALIKEHPIGTNYIINIRAEKVSLPPELSQYQWIDLDDNGWKQKITRAIQKKYKQLGRGPAPDFERAMTELNRQTDTQPRTIELHDEHMDFSGSYFVYNEHSDYRRYINAEIVAEVYRSFYWARSDFNFYEGDRPMSWSVTAEEFFREGDLLSLRFFWYQDAGGAHPSHGTHTMNFAGQQHGRIELAHLFSHSDEVAQHIKRYCELDVRRQLLSVGEDQEISFDGWLPDPPDWYHAFRNFGFRRDGITFNISPYDVMAYAFGSYEVLMPWAYFRDKLNETFKGSQIYALVHRD